MSTARSGLPGRRDAHTAHTADRTGFRRALLSALFLAIALAGVIALLVLKYEVEALVTVITVAAVEASAALGWRPALADRPAPAPTERTR